MLLWEIVDQNEYGHVYVEATSVPLALSIHARKNEVRINSEVSREFHRVQEEKNNE